MYGLKVEFPMAIPSKVDFASDTAGHRVVLRRNHSSGRKVVAITGSNYETITDFYLDDLLKAIEIFEGTISPPEDASITYKYA